MHMVTSRLDTRTHTHKQVSSLSEALLLYRWVVEYHENHSEIVERVFPRELPVCKEMVELMPHKIAAIRQCSLVL